MEKNQPTDQGRMISSPLSIKDSPFGVNNPSSISGNIRNIINIPSGAWIGEEARGLIRIITPDSSSLYNLKYYTLIGKDKTQQELIKRVFKKISKPSPIISKHIDIPKQIPTVNTVTQLIPTPTLNPSPSSKTLDEELKQLETLTSICKTLNTYHDREDKLKTTKDQDKKVLLKRQQEKQKTLIEKRLKELRKDNLFSISENKAHYKGQYVQAVKTINLGAF